MKTAEILRNILNLLDAEEAEAAQQPVVVNINNGAAADAEQPQGEPVDDNLGIMVPPLQQKIELMKKSAGVASAYDEDPEEDELATLKRHAGLNTAVIADEDEPLEG
jgi:hypothetical protein